MLIFALFWAACTALIHGYIFYLEYVRFGSPSFCRVFGIAPEHLPQVQAAFRNLGIYNLNLAMVIGVGMVWRIFAENATMVGIATGLLLAGLACVAMAGGYLWYSAPSKRRAAIIQAVPALLALLGLCLA